MWLPLTTSAYVECTEPGCMARQMYLTSDGSGCQPASGPLPTFIHDPQAVNWMTTARALYGGSFVLYPETVVALGLARPPEGAAHTRDEDVFAHLYLGDRPLKLGAARIEEIAEAVAGRHMSESTEALRFAGAGLTVQLIRGPQFLAVERPGRSFSEPSARAWLPGRAAG
jgi:hypothetical protein